MKKFFGVIFLCVVICMSFVGCGKKYSVNYCGEKDAYKGAKDYYSEGASVKLIYINISTDTGYTFFIDDDEVDAEWSEKNQGYVIRFRMPDHNVKVKCIESGAWGEVTIESDGSDH